MKNFLILFITIFLSGQAFGQVTMIEGKAGRDTNIIRNFIKDGNAESFTAASGCAAYNDTQTYTSSSGLVDEAGDLINVGAQYIMRVGQKFRYTGASGAIGGLTSGNDYFVVARGGTPGIATTIQVSATEGGAAINLTSDGTGSQVLAPYLPFDGTGGTADVTFGTTTTSPLELKKSFNFVKGAADYMGQGFGCNFTIDTKDKAKVLSALFDYLVSSGTFVPGSTGVDSDVMVYIVDRDNANNLIEMSSKKLLSSATTLTDQFLANWQTPSNAVNFRLVAHVSTHSTSAYTLKIDSIKSTPTTYTLGTPITDWANYTPVLGWTNATGTGKFRRVGDTMQGCTQAVLTGTPVGTLNFGLPAGTAIDTAKQNSQTTLSIGKGGWFDSATTGTQLVSFTVGSSTTVNPLGQRFAAAGNNDLIGFTPTGLKTFVSTDYVTGCWEVPISGWSSSVQMSDNSSSVPVVFSAFIGSSVSVTNNTFTKLLFNSESTDSHNAYDTTNSQYIVPVAGDYNITIRMEAANYASASDVQVHLYKNGVTTRTYQRSAASVANTLEAPQTLLIEGLKVGDILDVRMIQNSGGSVTVGASPPRVNFMFQGHKISGNQTIASSGDVNFKSTSASTSVATGGSLLTMNITGADIDTHGMLGTNLVNIPSAGVYDITITGYAPTAASGALVIAYSINGVDKSEVVRMPFNSATGLSISGKTQERMNSGDIFRIRALQNTGSSQNINFILNLNKRGL